MKNFLTERGSVLMETVIVMPIFILIFLFIVDATQIARDQLQVETLGLSAVRIAANHDAGRRNDLGREELQKHLDKDHRTNTKGVKMVDGDTVCKGCTAAGVGGAPWTVLVGARAAYEAPADGKVWLNFEGTYLQEDGSGRPSVPGERKARTKTYMLSRSAASFSASNLRNARAACHIQDFNAAGSLKHLLDHPYLQIPKGTGNTAGEWTADLGTVNDAETAPAGSAMAEYSSKRMSGQLLYQLANSNR